MCLDSAGFLRDFIIKIEEKKREPAETAPVFELNLMCNKYNERAETVHTFKMNFTKAKKILKKC